MTSLILLLALTTPGQTDADKEKRQVYEIQLEHRVDGLDDRANHADAVYLDILARAAAPVDPDKLVQSREEYRLKAENRRLPFNESGYVGYWLGLTELAVGYAEVARELDDIGRTALADHARRQAGLWTERADAMKQNIKRTSAELSHKRRAIIAGALTSDAQLLREKVNPIFRVFRFLGTIPPLHALAVFVALALIHSRAPKRRTPQAPRSSP